MEPDRYKFKDRKRLVMLVSLVLISLVTLLMLRLFIFPADSPELSIPDDIQEYATYRVINKYPHDSEAFTQGLIYLDGFLYESTGLYGSSSLRKVQLETGEVLQSIPIDKTFFAEGLAHWNGKFFQLTWREQIGFIYDKERFLKTADFTYGGEGWGLTQDGNSLIMSNGTDKIQFLDPDSLKAINVISVSDNGRPINNLNELEFIDGEIFANIWQTDHIIRIDPLTGKVKGWIDLKGLLDDEKSFKKADVLNGIAYDDENDRLFVTGKFWPYLYEIVLVNVEQE